MIDATNPNTALASALVEELARSGMRQAVISPGSRSTPLAVALHRHSEIQTSVVIDERSAGFLALGTTQATGLPVAVLCTSGTAAANLHPAICEADLSAVPLIALTADRPTELRDIGAGQTIDQLKLYGESVRWFCEVGTHAADDSGLLHYRSTACRAYAAAAGDLRPGPVHLNLAWREPLAPVDQPEAVTATRPLALAGRDPKPLTSVVPAEHEPSATTVDSLARRIAAEPKGLILVGRQTDPALREPLAGLARSAGYPTLAEPTSQLRAGPHDRSNVLWRYDEIAAAELADGSGGRVTDSDARGQPPSSRQTPDSQLAPGLILRFGEFPTSKSLRTWIGSLEGTEQIVVDPAHGWYEPTRIAAEIIRADPVVLTERLAASLASEPPDPAFLHAWKAADREHAEALTAQIGSEQQLSAAALHHALATCYRDGDLVYTNSSLPIREQEWYLPPTATDVTFLANRGANGIDGLISSGIGAAVATGRPTVILTGDVALLHDLGALASVKIATAPVRIVVINNGGGRIFDRLPQGKAMPAGEFEDLMTTPPGIEPAKAAALFDLPYTHVTDLGALQAALDAGTSLIEVQVPS